MWENTTSVDNFVEKQVPVGREVPLVRHPIGGAPYYRDKKRIQINGMRSFFSLFRASAANMSHDSADVDTSQPVDRWERFLLDSRPPNGLSSVRPGFDPSLVLTRPS
jgi:hypothetical protein